MRGGGFAQGCRNRGAYYFAFALQRLGVSTANVEMKVSTYAARCRPPITPREWQGAIGSASMGKGAAAARIVRNDCRDGVQEIKIAEKVSTYAARCRPPITPREWQGAGSASMGTGV